MRHPKGRVVEVAADKQKIYETKGFELVEEKPAALSQKDLRKMDFAMPISIRYPFDGYGRLGGGIKDRCSFDQKSNVKVFIGTPAPREKNDPKDIHILFTMFEADKIPQEWVDACNMADGAITPSKWCKEVFHNSGVKVPIEVVNLATDCFDIVEPDDSPFIFAHQNSFVDGDQKGWQLVIKAFSNVFNKQGPDEVQLHLKGRKHAWANDHLWLRKIKENEKIVPMVRDLGDAEMRRWWENINCFVFPSRGEGFGLPPLEAMARGIPTILTDAHSHTEFSEHGITIGTVGKAPSYYVGRVWQRGIGEWVEPNYQELEEKMWDVFQNYKKYKKEAVRTVPVLEEKFSWDTMLDNFEKAVKKLAK